MTRLGKTWVVLFLAYLAAMQLFTVVAIPPENVALLWLPNAVLAVALLKTDRRWWWSLWLVALAAEIAGDVIQGMGPGPAIWWGTVNVLEATAVASVLSRFGGDQPFLRSVRSVSVFVLAALAIPAATGTIGALGSTLEFGSDWRDAWQAWWFGDAIGFLVGVPIGLALFDLRSSMVTERSRLARLGYGAAVATTVLAAVLLALSERTSSAEHVAIAAGILAALGFGSAGAAAGCAIVAVIAIVPSASEQGTMGILETQAFLFVLATAILFVGAAIEAERASLAALRRSEARFRTTFEDAPIGMALSDLTSAPPGRWNEVNAALARTLGYRPADLTGTDPDLLVHPGDRQAGELDAALSASGHAADSERRYRHADGHYLWCRVVRSIVHDPTTGEPSIAITQLEDITATKEVADQLAHAALHDPLTGLPNRLLLMDRLDQQLASLERVNGLVALFYVDLDQFKKINDLLGHDAGDRVLTEVARRLLAEVRPNDTVARIGGDEFVVACGDLADDEQVLHLADRLSDGLNRPAIIAGRVVDISGSIGVAITRSPAHDPSNLLRAADLAMYRAKSSGRRRVGLFDEQLAHLAIDRLEVEAALQDALRDERLVLHYQPIVDLRSDEVVAVEALLRYLRPGGELVEPGSFLHVAEESGLIVPIGRWVMREACRQAARWQEELNRPPQVSINLSGRQIADPDFRDAMLEALEETGVDPSLLCLEVTETVFVDAPRSLIATIDVLKSRGLTLAIDDFGTGYSSLTYLKRFPVDRIKIDRSFTAGLAEDAEDRAIVAAVTGLGRQLDLSVVAEGVESAEQLELLRGLGCDLAQGFLFASAVPPDALAAILR